MSITVRVSNGKDVAKVKLMNEEKLTSTTAKQAYNYADIKGEKVTVSSISKDDDGTIVVHGSFIIDASGDAIKARKG